MMEALPQGVPAWVIALAWLVREVTPKITELLMQRPSQLRKDIDGLKVELDETKAEMRRWQSRFYIVLDAFVRNDRTVLERVLSEKGEVVE